MERQFHEFVFGGALVPKMKMVRTLPSEEDLARPSHGWHGIRFYYPLLNALITSHPEGFVLKRAKRGSIMLFLVGRLAALRRTGLAASEASSEVKMV
jgi:hypothetical protein